MSGEGQALRIERVSTGVAGLDEVLGGGIPARSITVVSGEPGAGKTVLALQMRGPYEDLRGVLTGVPVAAGKPTP